MSMNAGKRASEGDGAVDSKRHRPSAAPTGRFNSGSRRVDLLNPATPRSDGGATLEEEEEDGEDGHSKTEEMPSKKEVAHPMDALDAVRTRLTATTDPHLQARLLLRFSEAAISPGALTDAAIDFLFAFLQENQQAGAGNTDARGTQDPPRGGADAGSSGAIVVGAIVRGLRSLLAVKAAVVEPMIQVDAMGEQLMQCLSVGEDFKLRRDMLRIVVDCLVLSRRFAQVAKLLATCVRDHDAGMQAICLRGYLRLHDAGYGLAITNDAGDAADAVVNKTGEHFDRLAAFLLHGDDEDVRVLAARAIAAFVGETHVQRLEIQSAFFPGGATTTSDQRLVLQDMAFYVLCMASNDMATSVRVESTVAMRGLIGRSSCVDREVVEHALVKTPVDDLDDSESSSDDGLRSVRMMSSGALLSLLEDASTTVAEEASRTIARLEPSPSGVSSTQWSERVLRRVVTAHFDVLARLDATSEVVSLRQVLVTTLKKLTACLHRQYPSHDMVLSTEEMNSLLYVPPSPPGGLTKWFTTVLSILALCNLSSVECVRRTLDFVLSMADKLDASTESLGTTLGTKRLLVGLSDEVIDMLSTVGDKCAPVLRVNSVLSAQLADAIGGNTIKLEFRRALRLGKAYTKSSTPSNTAGDVTSAFARLAGASNASAIGGGVSEAAALLAEQLNVTDSGAIASGLKAIQRLRSHFEQRGLPTCYLVAEALIRLKDSLRPLPSDRQSSASPPTPSLRLPLQALRHCRDLSNLARSALVKQFALSSACRSELIQLVLLARIGVVLSSTSSGTASDRHTAIESLARDASRAQELLSGAQPSSQPPSWSSVGIWLNFDALCGSPTVEDFTNEFVRVARTAWPRSWLSLAVDKSSTGSTSIVLAEANASIFFDDGRPQPHKDPLEVTANWPFTYRVQAVGECVRDISQVFIKSVLPDGETQFHKVPLSALKPLQSAHRFAFEHSISLIVSPFSDPTSFSLSICVRHDRVPGTDDEDDKSPAFTDISPRVSIPIFHRTTSALRPTKA